MKTKTDDLPPANLEAEKMLLASVFALPESLNDPIVTSVKVGDFIDIPHRTIWRHLIDAHQQGQSPEVIPVTISAAGEMNDDTRAAVFALMKTMASGGDVRTYAHHVRESAGHRRLWEFNKEIGEQIRDRLPPEDIQGFMSNFMQSFSFTTAEDGGVETIGLLSKSHTELRRAVLNGLLREGEVLNLVAPPKTGKSWLVYQLLLCMVTGRRFLGYLPSPGKVLLVDNELHKETLAFRIPISAKAMGIGPDEYEDQLLIKSLRGKWTDIYGIGRWLLTNFKAGELKVVVVDSWYRALPRGTNENDPGTMAEIYNYVDTVADRLGCAVVNIHHSTKGSQAMKAVTDVGSGSGVQSRAADTHLVLRAHEQAGVYVADAVVRSWAPVDAICVRNTWPLWSVEENLDPSQLKQERPRQTKSDKGDSSSVLSTPFENRMQKVRDALAEGPLTKTAIRRATNLSGQSITEAVNAMLEFGEIESEEVETKAGKATAYRLVEGNLGQPRTTTDSPGCSPRTDNSAPYRGAVVLSGVDVTGAPFLLSQVAGRAS